MLELPGRHWDSKRITTDIQRANQKNESGTLEEEPVVKVVCSNCQGDMGHEKSFAMEARAELKKGSSTDLGAVYWLRWSR